MVHRDSSAAIVTTLRRALRGADALAYDAFVDRARGGCYTQARAWAPAAVAGRAVAPRWFLARRRERVVGAALVLRSRIPGGPVLPFAVVERGPVVDDLSDLADVLGGLRERALRAGITRLSVMPYWADRDAEAASAILREAGFRDVQTASGAHARTLRVALGGKAEGAVFAGKSGEALRRKLRQAEKAGATARAGTPRDREVLARLVRELMAGQGRAAKPPLYFEALFALAFARERGAVFVCEHEGRVVSALYVARHGALATFVVGASARVELPFSKMAPAMALAVRWAHERGCEAFDLGGFPLEGDTDEKRRSIAQFKLDFAKAPIALVGEHARWF